MTDAGFFKGTNTEQDSRFADKRKKLLKSMKFGDNLSEKVDTQRVNVESIKPWIIKRITELLSFDDEIVCDFVVNMLAEQFPDPKEIQINLSAFLGSKNARIFVGELWDLLLSAMNTPGGVPAILLEAKKAELLSSKAQEEKSKSEQSSRPTPVAPVDRPRGHGDGPSSDPRSPDSNRDISPAHSDRRRRHYSSSPESPVGRSDRERRRRDEERDRSHDTDNQRRRRHSRSPSFERHGSRHHRHGHRHHDRSPRDRRYGEHFHHFRHHESDFRDHSRRDRSREVRDERRALKPDGPICATLGRMEEDANLKLSARNLLRTSATEVISVHEVTAPRSDSRIGRDERKSPVHEVGSRSRGGADDVYREERRVGESDTDGRGSRHRSHRRDDDFYDRRRDDGRVTMDNETYFEERHHRYEPIRNINNSNLVELTESEHHHGHHERDRSFHQRHHYRENSMGRGGRHGRHSRRRSFSWRRSRSPEGPLPMEVDDRRYRASPEGPLPPIDRASPEGPLLPKHLRDTSRSAKPHPKKKSKRRGGKSSESSSSSTTSSDSSSSSSDYSSSSDSGSSSGSSASDSDSDESSVSSSSSSSAEKLKKRKHHGKKGKFGGKKKGHKRSHKMKIVKKTKCAFKKVEKSKKMKQSDPILSPEGPALPPATALTSSSSVVEWKERQEESSSTDSSSSSGSSSAESSGTSSSSSTESEERERRERLKKKLLKTLPPAESSKGSSQRKWEVNPDQADGGRSKRRRTDPDDDDHIDDTGDQKDAETGDPSQLGTEEDRLRRRALESLRRKNAGAAGGSETTRREDDAERT
ncbi:hypothetical protein Aperf_G00000130757 [Anoplocephala perfoliata]